MLAAATRAWYLPRCVRSPTPAASPIAQTPSPARSRSSTVTPRFVISTPSCSSPSPSTLGQRPVATSRRSASIASPDRGQAEPARAGSTLLGVRLDENPYPVLFESLGQQCAGIWIEPSEQPLVVLDQRHSDPIRRKNCASSTPTAPPPSTTRLIGHRARPDRLAVRPVLDVVEPFERGESRHRAGRDHELVVLDLAPADGDDSRLAPHAPRHARARRPAPSSQPACHESSRPSVTWSRHQSTRSTSISPVIASAAPGAMRAAASDLRWPQQCLRRQARVVGALAACERTLDDGDPDVRIEPTQRADEVLAARAGAEHDDAASRPSRRRGRDLNPRRTFQHVRDFQSRSLGRSDTSPRGDSLARVRSLAPGDGRDVRRDVLDLLFEHRLALDLDHHAVAVAVGFVPQRGDAFNLSCPATTRRSVRQQGEALFT